MDLELLLAPSPMVIAIAVSFAVTFFLLRYLQGPSPKSDQSSQNRKFAPKVSPENILLRKKLASILPNSVILPEQTIPFQKALAGHWAQQESETIPACIFQPQTVQELSEAVKILKQELDDRTKKSLDGKIDSFFGVRSGGHSPVTGAASSRGGVMIDLSSFRDITPSEDGRSVVVGTGLRWGEVSRVLDQKGLAVVAGRNADVGVGGFLMGGGLSFFAPRYGLACSNILAYEIVLASGIITTATATQNPSVFQALQGGANNFGVVTHFTLKSFPAPPKIFSGFLYMASFQSQKALSAFYTFWTRKDSLDPKVNALYDADVAGSLLSWSYIPKVNLQIVALHLAHSPPVSTPTKWPACFKNSSIPKLWSVVNTTKLRTLTEAYEELNALNPRGLRQTQMTATVAHDYETLKVIHATYLETTVTFQKLKIKGLQFTCVFQPFHSSWLSKPLGGIDPKITKEKAEMWQVIILCTIWDKAQDDEIVRRETRICIENIEKVARERGTMRKWQYLNYAGEGQKPIESYGEENVRSLWRVSKEVDPDGLFQKGCAGGFKLPVEIDGKKV